jgi:hypothetical protein
MSDGYKQPINKEALEKLKKELTEFCETHQPAGNPGIRDEVDASAAKVKQAMEASPDPGIALVGAATALRDYLGTAGMRMYFRTPLPK